MKKLEVSKYIVLGLISVGLIACGTPNGGSDDSTSTGSDSGDGLAVDGGHGAKAKKPVDGGHGVAVDGGHGAALTANNNDEAEFATLSADFADDHTLRIQGSVTEPAEAVSFVINGTNNYQVAVNQDLTFSIEIGVSDADKESMIIDFVVGDSVKTLVVMNNNIEFQEF